MTQPAPVEAAAPAPTPTARHGGTGRFRTLWLVGVAAFGLQLVGLVAWSRHLWDRFDLTSDFATFSQAWSQIGTGHLDPYETTFAYHYPHYGYPFWQSHFELVLWPLALLRAVGLSAFSLLVVQDLALVGFGLVLFRTGLEHLGRHWPEARPGARVAGAGLLVALLVSPWTYWAASFDFHVQPIAALFAALCARDVWGGRRRAWLWAALVLLCGDVAASYLVGLGLAALVSGRALRRQGIALVLVGVVWVVVVIAVGSGKGSSLAGNYGYLAHVAPAGGVAATVGVLVGILGHPADVVHVLRTRWSEIAKFVTASGTLGLASPWGAGMALAVLVPNALNQSGVFIGAAGAFQNLVAVGFLTVGSVAVLTWVLARTRGAVVVAVLGSVALAQVVAASAHWTPRARTEFARVDPATAAQLAAVEARLPPDAEVVVSQGVIGRFGARRAVYPFLDAFADGQTVPVVAPTVAFVFVPTAGLEQATPAQTAAAATLVRTELHARVVAESPQVSAFVWRPTTSVRTVHFAP